MDHSCWLGGCCLQWRAPGTCLPFLCLPLVCSRGHALQLGRKQSYWLCRQGNGCDDLPWVLTTGTVWQGGRLLGTRWSQCFHLYWNQCCELSHWCHRLWVQCSYGSWTASRFGGTPQMRWDLWGRKAQLPQHKACQRLLRFTACYPKARKWLSDSAAKSS